MAAAAPAQRAKRPLGRGIARVVQQLGIAPPRRSRRDTPTFTVGRRVRATFDMNGKASWFFGVVLTAAAADGCFLVGFDDGKREHLRADQLTIVDDG